MGSQKKRHKKVKRKSGAASYGKPYIRGYEELADMPDRKFLRSLPSYVGYKSDFGKEVYSWSDSRSWIDLSPGQKRKSLLSVQKLYLIVLAAALVVWFFISLIYRLVTETDAGAVLLSMLPSFIIIVVCTAILLLSCFGGWGGFLRWAYRHNLVRGRDAMDRDFHRRMKDELDRVDDNKIIECAVDVTEEYVILSVYGQKYSFYRNAVALKISKVYDMLNLVFEIDGKQFEFCKNLPKNQYVYLQKAFADRCTVNRVKKKSEFSLKKLLGEIPFLLVGAGIVAVSITAIVAHYLWIPELPPVIGVFFLLMSGFVFCNIFSDIPAVSEVGIPFVAATVFLVFPPMAYFWIECELLNNPLNFFYLLTHCTPFAAGFGFFFVFGFYTLGFAVSKAIDFVRFGTN